MAELPQVADGYHGLQGDYNLYDDHDEQPSDHNMREFVKGVLDKRPAKVRGQRLSMRRRSNKNFSRSDPKHQSLPRGGRANSNGRTAVEIELEIGPRRASSLPELQPALSVESIEGLDNFDRGRLRELRKSTRRLKERIAEQ